MKHLFKLFICFAITAFLMFCFYQMQGQPEVQKEIKEEICFDVQSCVSDWDKFRLGMYNLSGRLTSSYEFEITQYQLYDFMMKTVFAECKFKTGKAAINRISNARGSIQWMPKLRKKLGVPENIHEIPLHLQIPHIEKYFNYKIKRHRINTKKVKSFVDVYCIVFAPAYSDRSKDSVLYSKHRNCGSFCWKHKRKKCSYHANKGYDITDDGEIRKYEISEYVLNKHFRNKN